MKLGLALPSFVSDPAIPLRVAMVAEDAGVDGVFVYDHLFRGTGSTRRPALESTALLGAVAGVTSRISIGVLVSRAGMRPAATLAGVLATVHRIVGERLVTGIGAGDSQSRKENETFGLEFGSSAQRVEHLRQAVISARAAGVAAWVGGRSPEVRALAAELADGWNSWGSPVDGFATEARAVREAASRESYVCSWGGLVALSADDDAAEHKATRHHGGEGVLAGGPERLAASLRAYGEAGADWVIVAPLDSEEPTNAELLGREVRPRL